MFAKLKVVELSTVLAGPSVGMFFAELGADVVKVEHPMIPDVTRSWKLASEDPEEPVSAYFSSVNYGKHYLRKDLTKNEDREDLYQLIIAADILLVNFKKGDDVKFSLTPEELWQRNPRLLIGKITGFGDDSDRVAYDLILQAESGFMSMNGTPESGPVKMPVALIDVLAAHQLKEGLLVALLERSQDQTGRLVSVSLFDAAVSSLVNQASNFLMEHHVPKRIGSLHPNIAPYGELFLTSDEKYITFAIGSDRHFAGLCTFLKLNYLPEDPRFRTNVDRVKNRKMLFELLNKEIQTRSSVDINAFMLEHFIPMGIVKSLDEVFSQPEAQQLVREETIDGKKTRRVTSIAFHAHKNQSESR